MARYPTGILSIVSDTWDFWKVITKRRWELKHDILARQPDALGNAKLVFRPDSGDPVKIITGLTMQTSYVGTGLRRLPRNCRPRSVLYGASSTSSTRDDDDGYDGDVYNERITLGKEVPAHIVKGAVECLWDIFGGDYTDKGFKTLNQRVGLIYGDSITLQREEAILSALQNKGFSAGNLVYGIGSLHVSVHHPGHLRHGYEGHVRCCERRRRDCSKTRQRATA
jgi:nicotinamide phosphoribosyltransferase